MKPCVALLEGGFTDESIISNQSANTIYKHIDTSKFDVYRVKITDENWIVFIDEQEFAINKNDFSFMHDGKTIRFDAVFNMLHGTPGEDGKLQGYFDILNIPYTGGDVLNMALTFDKKVTTTVLGQNGFNVAKSVAFSQNETFTTTEVSTQLRLPLFVKPSTAGSSLGISKVTQWDQLDAAIAKGLSVSKQVMVEEMITGTEVTCGVIKMDGKTVALPVTEIVCINEFFDYDAKYHSVATEEITPARINDKDHLLIKDTAVKVFETLNCKSFVRIDFIIHNKKAFIIEVNTVPGMSERSLVPQQLEHAGISLTTFISSMIEDCLRH